MDNFKWCLVGNIVQSHTYGEEHEIRYGSKQFAPGAKVFIAPANWGDGYENVIVIGCPRRCRHYIEIIMRSDLIENVRSKKVYAPFLLKMMDESQYTWWGSSEEDRECIESLAASWNEYRKKAFEENTK